MNPSLNMAYRNRLADLYWNNPYSDTDVVVTYNERTGDLTRSYVVPQVLAVDITQGVPCPRWRRLSPHVPFADTLWQLMGTTDLRWLNRWAAYIWGPYAEDGILPKAYGVRWDWQLPVILQHLRNDSTSRQVYMSTWFAPEDCKSRVQCPMPPCLTGIQFQIRESALEATIFARSTDVVIGLPHDIMNIGFLTWFMARELGLTARAVHLVSSNLHLYEGHMAAVGQMLGAEWLQPIQVKVPTSHTISNLRYLSDSDRDILVQQVRDLYRSEVAEAPRISVSISR